MRTIIIVPLSCFCPHLAVVLVLLGFLPLSFLVMTCLTFTLELSCFILAEEKQKDHYLKNPREYCSFSSKEFLGILIHEKEL